MSRMIDADALKDILKDKEERFIPTYSIEKIIEMEKIIENIKEIEVGGDCRHKCKSYDWSVGACQGDCEDYIKSEAIDIVKEGWSRWVD